ncbi:uracil-DNA glycosylase [Candidatus Dependentiae bacterium]|nr:uracil-DNA glycosylase [Candidatus Dependentiae bacterium]
MKNKTKLENYFNFIKQQPNGFLYYDKKKHHKINKKEKLEKIKIKYEKCQNCPLANLGRIQVVFGQGNPNAKLMFVGEGPGRDEDLKGVPFIGRAGKLLTKIIQAMKFTRQEVYISNVVKCRPPNNRLPTPEESQTCKNLILFNEIKIIKPKIICTLGACATQALLGDEFKISKSRGNFYEFHGILIIPTFHPAYLLRNPNAKKDVWKDMKKIIKKLDE